MAFVYNGVDLSYVLSQRVTMGPEYEESGTDQNLTAIRIRVQSVLNAALLPATGGELVPGTTAARIRHLLTAPRKSLVYSAGGDYQVNLPDGLDDANGPKPDPDAFSITQFTEQTFIVTFAVTVRLIDCTGAASVRGWTSLRWEENVQIGRDWLSTYRRSGTLVLSGRATSDPDAFRGLVTPTCPPGFQREEANYTLSASGLEVKFRFVDKELMQPGPFPSIRMRGHQIESTPMPGAVRYGEIELTLDGPKGVSSGDLLRAAARVAFQNALAAGVNVGKGAAAGRYLIGGAVRKSLNQDENSVSLSLKWQIKAGQERMAPFTPNAKAHIAGLTVSGGASLLAPSLIPAVAPGSGEQPKPNKDGKDTGGMPFEMKWLDNPLAGTDPNRTVVPGTRGTAETLKLVAAALGDLCGQVASVERSMDEANQLVGTTPSGAKVTVKVLDSSTDDPDDFEAYYEDDPENPGVYSQYSCNLIYKDTSGSIVLPGTGVGDTPDKGKKITVAGRTLSLTVEFTGEKTGGPVEIPSPAGNDNWVYVDGVLNVENLDLAGDGVSPVHKIAGIWNFQAIDPAAVRVLAAVPPFLKAALLAGAAAESASRLATDIIGNVLNGAVAGVTNVLTNGATPPAAPSPFPDGNAVSPSNRPFPGTSFGGGFPSVNP